MADELPQWKRPPKRRQRTARTIEQFISPTRRPRIALSAAAEAEIARRFARLQADRPLQGFHAFLRLCGLRSAASRAAFGSSAFGHWIHGQRGGNAVRSHRYLRGRVGSIPGYPTLRPWLKTPEPEP